MWMDACLLAWFSLSSHHCYRPQSRGWIWNQGSGYHSCRCYTILWIIWGLLISQSCGPAKKKNCYKGTAASFLLSRGQHSSLFSVSEDGAVPLERRLLACHKQKSRKEKGFSSLLAGWKYTSMAENYSQNRGQYVLTHRALSDEERA